METETAGQKPPTEVVPVLHPESPPADQGGELAGDSSSGICAVNADRPSTSITCNLEDVQRYAQDLPRRPGSTLAGLEIDYETLGKVMIEHEKHQTTGTKNRLAYEIQKIIWAPISPPPPI